MSPKPHTTYFLVVFDNDAGRRISLNAIDDPHEAIRRYDEVEATYLDLPRVEVVLLGAASEDAIRVTHPRYFYDGYHSSDSIESMMAPFKHLIAAN